MASATHISSPTPNDQHNPHPYPIKTSHTGLLTRSNSSKAHGSWSKHHYTPAPPSPSAFVFDPPVSSLGAIRRQTQPSPLLQPLHASPSSRSQKRTSLRGSERSGSMSPLPSNYSRSWVGRNSEGEQVNLPRHPYLWNPAQLAAYLSSELYGSDGEPLGPDVVKPMVDFIQQRKIGGRAFLNLDQEDFQEMEGIDSLWSNALWDASSVLRQGITPYRPSRLSSTTYKRGRVRGVVNLFERSASEGSDVGEEGSQNKLPGKALLTDVSSRKYRRKTPTKKWNASESEDDLKFLDIDDLRQNHLQRNVTGVGDLEVPPSMEPYTNVGTSTLHNVLPDVEPRISLNAHVGVDSNESPQAPLPGIVSEDNLAVVIPPQSDTPVNIVLAPDEFPSRRAADSPEPNTPANNTLINNTDVEIVSTHPREIPEPTMAELYEQTYGPLPSSSRSARHASQAPSDEAQNETVKLTPGVTTSVSDPPSTALRPIIQRKAASPPPSLRRLFASSSVVQTASETEPQSVYVIPANGSQRDEAAVHTLSALKERLAIVERRLEAMEMKDSEPKISEKAVSRRTRRSRKTSLPTKTDQDDLDLEFRSSRSSDALRSWQSAYILLAGATTGVSIVLIPMLLRHLWSR